MPGNSFMGSKLGTTLLISVIIGVPAVGMTAFWKRGARLKNEIYHEVMAAVEFSNRPVILSFDKDNISYQPCKIHGTDLVVSGTTDDGRNLAVSIFDSPGGARSGLYGVLMAEGEGRMRFPQGNSFASPRTPPYGTAFWHEGSISGETTFYQKGTRTGHKRADRVSILDN